jgi:hypothetical protein
VKDFFWRHLLPFGGVAAAVVVLTLALFDVPQREGVAVFGLRVSASAEPIARSPGARAHVNDTLREVLRTLDDGRRPTPDVLMKPAAAKEPSLRSTGVPAAPASPGATTPPAAPTADPELLKTATSLGDAVRAIHDARTEEDLLRAEELVRVVRERMEATCGAGSGPLCQSAEQIKSLGY